MSHPLVAAVWEQLGRRDLANILREIIGQHAVDIAVLQAQDDPASKVEPLTRSVFWIKTIFDAQRTRLRDLLTTHDMPTSNNSPYLLPSDSIFSTLMYLVQVKSKLFPCNRPVAPGLMCYRHFIAHTLLAGIRLLVLRGDDISAEDKFNLERAMAAAWQHPDLTGAELFLINDLLPRAVYSTGSLELSGFRMAHLAQDGKNPPVIPGLERLDGNPETLITDLLTALIRNKAATLAPFCWLYDILCSAESALIQCHINWRRTSQLEGPSSPAADTIDDTLEQARNTRTKLVRTVLAAFDDEFEVPSLQVLSTVILSQNADGHPPLQTRRIRDNWARLAPMREFWEASLGYLIRWLINRRVQMWDSNGELDASSHDYQAHLAEWLQASPLPGASPLTETRPDSVYMVDCPAGHAVPRKFLDERVRSSDPCAYERLQDNPISMSLDCSCPFCPGNARIHHIRLIELSERPSSVIQGLIRLDSTRRYSFPDSVSQNTTSASSSLSHSTSKSSARIGSGDSLRSPISPASYSGFYEMTSKPSTPEFMSPLWAHNKPSQMQVKKTSRSLSRDFKGVKLSLSGGASLFRRSSSRSRQLSD